MKKLKKEIYHEKGITLIALVVTIVVLIILSVVTFEIAFKEDGIIEEAEDSKKTMEEQIDYEKNELPYLYEKYYWKTEVTEYAKGYKLLCIYTNNEKEAYKYNGELMYDITDSGYQYYLSTYLKVYGTFITEDFDLDKVEKVNATTAQIKKVTYSLDINNSGKVDLNDAVCVVAGLNGNEAYFKNHKEICFRADVNKDKRVDTKDIDIVKEAIQR